MKPIRAFICLFTLFFLLVTNSANAQFRKKKKQQDRTEASAPASSKDPVVEKPIKSKKTIQATSSINYARTFSVIDSLRHIDQPKTTREKVLQVKASARKDMQVGYFIRALQYELELIDRLEERTDVQRLKWELLNRELQASDDVFDIFIHLEMADLMKRQYMQSKWNRNRIADDSSKNPADWGNERLLGMARTSIDNSLLMSKDYSIGDYLSPIIDFIKEHHVPLNLEQVVANSAIGILHDFELPVSILYISPAMEDAMSEWVVFSKKDFKVKDDPKNEYRILSLYQLVLSDYHLYFDLQRLKYVKAEYPNSAEYFVKACEILYGKYSSDTFSNLVAIELALYYQAQDPAKALAILDKAIKLHPDFVRARMNGMIAEMTRPSLSAELEGVYEPGKMMLAKVRYNNVRQLFVRAYRINYKEYLNQVENVYYGNEEKKKKAIAFIASQELIGNAYSISLPVYNDYKTHTSEIALTGLPEGMHLFVISNTDTPADSLSVVSFSKVSVSRYAAVKEGKSLRLISAEMGDAQAAKSFKIYEVGYSWQEPQVYKLVKSGVTDKDGRITFPESKEWEKNYVIEVEGHVVYASRFSRTGENIKEKDAMQIHLLTDRSIYRPGQKVYFKAIAYMRLSLKTVASRKLTVILKDNNYEEKGKLALTTNAYGSVSGSFILPKAGLNTGDFTIEIEGINSVSFRVEEYKRPKYTAKILVPEKAYKFNDEVIISGEAIALAGYAIQGAKVEYTVKRKEKPKYWEYWFRGPANNGDEQTIKSGNVMTGTDGKFNMTFKATPDAKANPKDNPYFIFTISATVTDLNGEVRTASYEMTMAYTDRELSIVGEQEYITGEMIEIKYVVQNLQQQTLPFTGTISLKKAISTEGLKRKRLWERSDTTVISSSDFAKLFPDDENLWAKEESELVKQQTVAADTVGKFIIPSLEPGEYVMIVNTVDGNSKMIERNFRFHVNPAVAGAYKQPEALKVVALNGESFEPGQKVRLLIAGGVEKAVARLSIKSNRGVILEKDILVASNAQIIEIAVKAEDRGNIIAAVEMVYHYRAYRVETNLLVPYSNKELDIRLSSFRSDMEPGSREKWVMTLKGPASEKAALEVAAVMYDQSLDQLYMNENWPLYPYHSFYQYKELGYNLEKREFTVLQTVSIVYDGQELISYPQLNMFDGAWYGARGGRSDGRYYKLSDNVGYRNVEGMAEMAGGATKLEGYFSFSNAGKKEDSETFDKLIVSKDIAENNANTSENPLIRKNFNETAFFYPHLYANAKGEIHIEFSMPEALTQWKMMMLAHSTTMQLGYAEQSVTTSKKVMVQPNMPRFLRQGDKISIAAKIINTTKEAITSKVSIRIVDQETGKTLTWLAGQNDKPLAVPADGNAACTFALNVPDYTGVVSVAIYATAGDYSDGEENTLLVLSNRKLVTETMPITIRKAGTQQLELKHLKDNASTTLKHEKFTVEMSSNPAWYAVQALPYMMEYPHECAEQVFTRLYANSIATYIANSDPAIKKVYEAWEKESTSGSGLQSKLMQNQGLKTAVLEETPWLAEAKNETQRMRKLGVLFNRAKMQEEIKTAFDKLKDMQSDNGAWPWFKGMGDNNYITQTIVIGFGKMKKMGVDISAYQQMIGKAINFLDQQAKRDYAYYMSLKEAKNIYPANLQYLYCKSYFPKTGLADSSRVLQYFISNAEKTWTQNSLMNRAQLAVALHILKPSSAIPQLIITSMNENAKQTDEMGMYWPQNTGGWYWYEAPVETQSAIIEAYKVLGNNSASIREQQVWLLRQKQSQGWKTTRSTADACYALLMNGQLLLSKQEIRIAVDNKAVVPEKTEAGTGYFRQDIAKENISVGTANVSVTAATSDFAYGAVYWQYFEDMDKIQSAGAGLSIVKRLYRITHTATGDQRTEIKAGDVLHVGDMIEISLSISSDRNLEFVHIKDQRASGTEPSDVLSVYHWQNGLGYYQSTRDASTNFFIDYLSKGNYQLNYTLKVEQAGAFNSGIATAQCMYAPEYAANSTAIVMKVE